MRSVIDVISGVLTAIVGYTIHGSIIWSIVDYFLWPLVICKWLIYHEVTFAIIKQASAFLG